MLETMKTSRVRWGSRAEAIAEAGRSDDPTSSAEERDEKKGVSFFSSTSLRKLDGSLLSHVFPGRGLKALDQYLYRSLFFPSVKWGSLGPAD